VALSDGQTLRAVKFEKKQYHPFNKQSSRRVIEELSGQLVQFVVRQGLSDKFFRVLATFG
jgi:hypothetical protein